MTARRVSLSGTHRTAARDPCHGKVV